MSSKESLAMLSKALEIEKRGIDYYKKAVSECKNELGKKIFQMLLEDESIHMDRIRRIFGALATGDGWSKELIEFKSHKSDVKNLFKEIVKKHEKNISAETSDVEALKIGMDFELATVKFYEEKLKESTSDLEREFIKRMIDEENYHYEALNDTHFYLTNPEAWFLEKEKITLDGA